MSWQASSWALREAPVGSDTTARLLLMALADRAHPDGTATWPSVSTLAQELQVTERTVYRKLQKLEALGVIRRGNQLLATHDAQGRPIPAQYRPVVWDLCMGVTLEEVAELSSNEDTGVRPDKMSPLEESQNKANSRPDKMSPLKSKSVVRPDTSVAPDLTPVSGKPLYKPNTPLPSKEGISPGEKIDDDVAWVEKVLWDALKLPVTPQRKDHRVARQLIDTYGLDLVLAVIAWCTAPACTAAGSKQDGFWRGVLRGMASLAKNWDSIMRQMSEDPRGATQLKNLHASDDSRLQVSLKTGNRYKIYRSEKITTQQGWDHLDDGIAQSECPACQADNRNQALHGVGVRDKLSDTPTEHSDSAQHQHSYHFIGHRTTTNIYATSEE